MSSSPQLLDVLLVGYGAVGVMYTYFLENSGRARVTAVARGNYALVKERGINIESGRLGNHPGWKPFRTFNSVAEAVDRRYHYVVVTTKALPDVLPTSMLLAPLLSLEYMFPQPTYVLAQNGLGVEEDLYAASKARFAQEPVIITGAVFLDASLTDSRDGLVQGTMEKLLAGLYRGDESPAPTPEMTASLQAYVDIMKAGGSNASVAENIQCEKFMKNRWNAVVASLCTLARSPPPAMSVTPRLEEIVEGPLHATLQELTALGQALGYPITGEDAQFLTNRTLRGFSKTSPHLPSMLVDVQRGSPLEVEVIIGTLVRWGKKHDVAMPRPVQLKPTHDFAKV
ncbi:6-phosphogluconate dehydrogenase C-terminal domain-like protein [Dacryopinax primogenitus]|uniref:6-phosphogluconate dehydrogenase C-terminal domain-like protein n=1 Tax=Dacryopinax primogenitus (strain DJM 731) TaxID=1858805 RepID=M5FYL0_DACPD|nr:6-phosphogluconate dehydrogenase C-terminal domain-like protein [Dacryopinax primogenitus]EJU01604.1 6-phosphogluconate dehydrogenase C-terminal domain-like protein [Dacryopinax primogenitus]